MTSRMDTVTFKCTRCGYETLRKADLKKHLQKKRVCPPTLADIDRWKVLDEVSKDIEQDGKYTCEFCEKSFATPQGKYQHKRRCTSNPESEDEMQDQLERMKEQIVTLQKELMETKNIPPGQGMTTVVNNTNNGIVNNNTIHNNITLNLRNFNQENMEAVPVHFLRSCFMNLEFATLFENLHCDPDYPENHNVRIKSSKRQLLEIYRNNRWNATPFVIGLKEVIAQLHQIFDQFYKRHSEVVQEDMNQEEIREILDKLEEIGNLNNKIIIPVKNELLAVLDTNRPLLTP